MHAARTADWREEAGRNNCAEDPSVPTETITVAEFDPGVTEDVERLHVEFVGAPVQAIWIALPNAPPRGATVTV